MFLQKEILKFKSNIKSDSYRLCHLPVRVAIRIKKCLTRSIQTDIDVAD